MDLAGGLFNRKNEYCDIMEKSTWKKEGRGLQTNGNIKGKQADETDHTLSRLAAIGQISAGIAHEVKNPLTSVKGFLQLLQEETKHSYLDLASSELDRAISILQNLLQVSKPDLDDESYNSINLCLELESIIYLFQDQLYRVRIEKNFSDTDQVIYGKKNQLKKAFFNLLKNAFEAIPEEGTIFIEHQRVGNSILLIIRDTGVGIPEEKIPLLGTPFFSTKDEGTGMGLTQVFSTIYQHGAKIDVKSVEGGGTTFMVEFPVITKDNIELRDLPLHFEEGQTLKEFMEANAEQFKEVILADASHIFQQIEGHETINQDYLLGTARRLIHSFVEGIPHEMIVLAKDHGKNWAKSNLPLILKMEWIQSFHKVYADFLYNYYKHNNTSFDTIIKAERETTFLMNTFTNHYISSYTEYNNDLLRSHRELIEELSVPVILLTPTLGVLPMVGTIDTYRAKNIQEKVLHQIESLKLKKMIVDLSGVAYMDTSVVAHLFRIIEGLALLGCKAIVTGIRSEIANTMIELGIVLTDKIEIQGTLQQALEQFGLKVAVISD